jgi:hypothetical protein
MALLPSDLIAPDGELDPELFEANDPGGNTEARVTSALAKIEEVNGGASDSAKTAWVYWRIYNAKAGSLANTPQSMTVDGESQSWAKHQIDHFRAMAKQYKAAYDEETQTVPVPAVRRSRSVRGRVVR